MEKKEIRFKQLWTDGKYSILKIEKQTHRKHRFGENGSNRFGIFTSCFFPKVFSDQEEVFVLGNISNKDDIPLFCTVEQEKLIYAEQDRYNNYFNGEETFICPICGNRMYVYDTMCGFLSFVKCEKEHCLTLPMEPTKEKAIEHYRRISYKKD